MYVTTKTFWNILPEEGTFPNILKYAVKLLVGIWQRQISGSVYKCIEPPSS